MNVTEQDIQAELIDGWSIVGQSVPAPNNDGGWFDIGVDDCRITFYLNITDIEFNYKEECIEADYTDFLTGNYDLSAISQHYELDEWQRIITMCERIVRLITGDYETGLDDTPEQVEQTLEEKVREILEPLGEITEITISHVRDDEVSLCNKVHQYWITSDKVIYSREDGNVEKTLAEYAESGLYVPEFKAIAALLTEQPEQTLEEAVKRHVAIVGGAKVVSVDEKNSVAYVRYARYKYAITPDLVFLLDQEEYPQATPVKEYHKKAISETWRDGVEGIAAEPSKHFTKPSREELSEKVAQLTGESYGLIPESRVKDTINEGFRSLISIEDGYGGCSASEAESDVKHCRELVASQEAILEDLTRKINQEKSNLKRLNGALEEAENVLEMARTIEQAIAGWRKTLQEFEEHTAPQEA